MQQEELEEEKQSLTASNPADPIEGSPKNNKVADDDQGVDGVEEQPRNVFTIVDEDIGQLTEMEQ